MRPIIAHRHAATVAVLVLAAGGSRRLGRPKALVRIRGQTLLVRTVRAVLGLGPQWVGVVVGAGASRLRAELAPYPVRAILARTWRAGLSASLRAGVRGAPPTASHLLVVALDQWALTARDFARLLRARGRVPVGARYEGIVGIPAVFPRRVWRSLGMVAGDRGARALLGAPGTRAVAIAAASVDLDTPADLRRLRAAGARRLGR